MQIHGQKFLITGATRGIGRALTQALAARGAQIVAVARDTDNLRALADELGSQVYIFPCDLADRADVARLAEFAAAPETGLNGLINNAGIQTEMAFAADPVETLTATAATEIEVNFQAPVHLCTALLPGLAQQDQAVIVNVTSALALAPKEDAPVYSATKAALRSFTIGLRYQAQRRFPNVTITEVIMALVDTDMTAGRGRGKITPQAAAAAILRGIERESPEIWVEKTRFLPLLGRLSPRIPARILR